MEESCPRCGAALPVVDDAPASFCAHCGLPQLTVSEGALRQANDPQPGQAPAHAAAAYAPALDWPVALRILAVAAVAGVLPAAFLPGSVADGTVSGPSLMLMPLLTLVAVGVYQRSRPQRMMSGAAGARMGATLGLFLGALIALITGIAGFVLRYRFGSHTMDDKISAATGAMLKQVTDAAPQPPEMLGFLKSPEFRAGGFIAGHGFTVLLLIFVGSVCGWVAGALLRARRQRDAA